MLMLIVPFLISNIMLLFPFPNSYATKKAKVIAIEIIENLNTSIINLVKAFYSYKSNESSSSIYSGIYLSTYLYSYLSNFPNF